MGDSPAFPLRKPGYGGAMKPITLASLALALLLLGACGPSDTDPGPGGVSVGEARALDEAAEMIEQRRLPPEAIETPAEESTDGPPAASEGE
jgi:hypothetical protein